MRKGDRRNREYPAWVVCLGEFRLVRGGRVRCPATGRRDVQDCLVCHWLEDAERDRYRDCQMPLG